MVREITKVISRTTSQDLQDMVGLSNICGKMCFLMKRLGTYFR